MITNRTRSIRYDVTREEFNLNIFLFSHFVLGSVIGRIDSRPSDKQEKLNV